MFAGNAFSAAGREIGAGDIDSRLHRFFLSRAGCRPTRHCAVKFDANFTIDAGESSRGINDENDQRGESNAHEYFPSLPHQ
jgi:hypothetical protein